MLGKGILQFPGEAIIWRARQCVEHSACSQVGWARVGFTWAKGRGLVWGFGVLLQVLLQRWRQRLATFAASSAVAAGGRSSRCRLPAQGRCTLFPWAGAALVAIRCCTYLPPPQQRSVSQIASGLSGTPKAAAARAACGAPVPLADPSRFLGGKFCMVEGQREDNRSVSAMQHCHTGELALAAREQQQGTRSTPSKRTRLVRGRMGVSQASSRIWRRSAMVGYRGLAPVHCGRGRVGKADAEGGECFKPERPV